MLVRVDGPLPVEGVPDDAVVLAVSRGGSFIVLRWNLCCDRRWADSDGMAYEPHEVEAYYRLDPPEWANVTNVDSRLEAVQQEHAAAWLGAVFHDVDLAKAAAVPTVTDLLSDEQLEECRLEWHGGSPKVVDDVFRSHRVLAGLVVRLRTAMQEAVHAFHGKAVLFSSTFLGLAEGSVDAGPAPVKPYTEEVGEVVRQFLEAGVFGEERMAALKLRIRVLMERHREIAPVLQGLPTDYEVIIAILEGELPSVVVGWHLRGEDPYQGMRPAVQVFQNMPVREG